MNTTLDNIRTAVSNTAPGVDDLTADAFASAVWSIIGEPGDQTAGHLIDTLGPSAALQVLLEDDSPTLEGFDVQTLCERTLPRATAGLITGAFRTAARFGAALLTREHPHWPTELVAGRATEVGRPVGAVPGSVTSAVTAGCHRLIGDYGATLVTNAEEVDQM
jgi:hypothetical protein